MVLSIATYMGIGTKELSTYNQQLTTNLHG
jgi:hypothetical protein